MKTTVIARKMTLKDSTREHFDSKLKKLEKFFSDDVEAKITCSIEGAHSIVEVTITDKSMIYRSQQKDKDVLKAFDDSVDHMIRQIRKHKTRLAKRIHTAAIEKENFKDTVEEDYDFNVIKTKKFQIKPLDIDEAILQMNLLNHQFYAFRNVDNNEINVVYKRKDGNYALIIPEN